MNLEQLQDTVRAVTSPAFRDRLLAKGQARSIIWRDGALPQGAPRDAGSGRFSRETRGGHRM